MKPLPAPNVPGRTDRERMDNALRHVFTSKDDLLKREAREKRKKERKKEQKRV
jgi:hypothetical protein